MRWLSAGFFKIAPKSIDLLSQHCNPLLVAAGHGNREGELQFFEAMVSLNKARACEGLHRGATQATATPRTRTSL